MKSSVSSLLVRRVTVTEVTVAEFNQFRVDSLNDQTVRPIPTAQSK